MKKKIFFALLILGGLLLLPSSSKALTGATDVNSLQALRDQITSLLLQIQQLQAQLAAVKAGSQGGSDALIPGSSPTSLPGGVIVTGSGQVDRATRLVVGDRVQAKDYLKVRKEPNVSATALMTAAPGMKGTVASGLKFDGTYWWVEVYWDNRTRGYSADEYLSEISMPISGVCGDLNGDGVVNVQDTTLMMLYSLQGAPIPTGVNADMDGDGDSADVVDKMLLDSYALRGGPAPQCVAPQRMPVEPTTPPYQPTTNSITETNVFVPDYSMCGDVNGDRGLNVFDQDKIRRAAFGGEPLPIGAKGDLNGDGVIDVLDVVIMTNYLNRQGSEPGCEKTNNAPKIIISPSIPASIGVGKSFQFAWTATDPDGDSLSWNVSWGDNLGGSCAPGSCSNQYLASHTWYQAGTYRGKVTVFDARGGSAAQDFSVNVVAVSQNALTSSGALLCGDVNLDGAVNDADSTLLSDYVFGGVPIPDMKVVDLNGDGVPNIVDVTLLINKLKNRTPVPTCPLLNSNNLYSPFSGPAGT